MPEEHSRECVHVRVREGPYDAALRVVDHLRRRFARFKLCVHFLKASSERFNLLLLLCNSRLQFLL